MKKLNRAKLVKIKSGRSYQRLLNKNLGTCGIKSGHVCLKPDESVGRHNTGEREEIIIVLKGKGEVIIEGDNSLKISKDFVLYIPSKTIHDVKNIGTGILEYIYVTAKKEIN